MSPVIFPRSAPGRPILVRSAISPWLAGKVPGTLVLGALALGALALGMVSGVALAAPVDLNIPAQPLSLALRELERQSGQQIRFGRELVEGVPSAGVSGRMEPPEALAQLLRGHDLGFRAEGSQLVVEGTGAKAAGAAELPTVTVSAAATKTLTANDAIPNSISVITREELDQRAVQDFNGAVAYTPGIRVVDYPGGQGAPDMYLRGFRTINFVGLYRDGLRGGFNAYDALVEPYGFESLEVLRGPASFLYGQTMPGGLVNATSKRPTQDPQNEVQLQMGTNERLQGAFDFSGPIDKEGKFSYRLTGLGRLSDTQVDYTNDDRTYIAPAFTWKPTAQTELTLLTSYLRTKGGGSEQSFPTNGTIYDNPLGKIPFGEFIGSTQNNKSEVENTSVGYAFRQNLDDTFTFHSNARYMHTNAAYDTVGVSSATLTANRFLNRNAQRRRQDSDQFLTDNNIEANFATGGLTHTLLVGIDYATYGRDELRRGGTIAPLDIFNPNFAAPVTWLPNPIVKNSYDIDQTGVYVQDQVEWRRWVLTGGLRKDWASSETTNNLTGAKLKYDDDAITGRAGLVYRFENGLSPYVSYGTSFLPQAVTTAFDGSTFEPTEGEQWEVGVKFQPRGYQSFINVALFDIVQTNVLSADSLHTGYFVTTGEVESKGIEIEGRALLAPGLTLQASYAYTDAEVTKDNRNASTGVSNQGNQMPSVPHHQASAWLDYTVQDGFLRGLGGGFGLRYVGQTYDASNLDKVEAYTLADAAIRYDLGALSPRLEGASFAINATNLFDKEYYMPGFSRGLVFAGNERQVLGTLSYRW